MITTVIPTFKRPLMLKRAIESVLAQSFTNLRVCVYDNASEDDTEQVVRRISERDKRVSYFKNDKNIGVIPNMIQGVNLVETDFYSLLNDDDFLLPGFYEAAVNAFKDQPDIGFACAKTVTIDLINRKVEFRNKDWRPGRHEPSNAVTSMMYTSHFVQTGVLLSRRMRDLIGAFEPSGNDSLYMTMGAAATPFVVLDHYGAAVTLHELAYSMIGEGIAKEEISTLYKNLLVSVDAILKIELPPEQKVHLLMLVINSYHTIFDSKKLNYLLGGQDEKQISDLFQLPSLITNRGLVSKIYNRSSVQLRLLIKYLYKSLSFVKRINNRRATKNWSALPEEAHAMLINYDVNVAKINSYLKNN